MSLSGTPTSRSPLSLLTFPIGSRCALAGRTSARREEGGDQRRSTGRPARPALDGRGLEQSCDLAGGDHLPSSGSEQRGGQPPIESAPPAWKVRSEERDAWDAKARHPPVVLAGEGVESGEDALQLRLRLTRNGRHGADEDLHHEQRLGRTELARQSTLPRTALDEIRRCDWSGTLALASQQLLEPVTHVNDTTIVVGSAEQPATHPSPLPGRDGKQVHAHLNLIAVTRASARQRTRECSERVRVQPRQPKRLRARPRQDHLGASDLHLG